MMSRTASAASP